MADTQISETSDQRLRRDTTPGTCVLPRLLRARGLQLFYGDLHTHTSYSDGAGRPEDALRQMRARGLHFAAITDHGELLDRETAIYDANKWAAAARQVAAVNDETFVAIRGFEWSSPQQGHSNVWCSTNFTSYHQTSDETIGPYYEWLASAQPNAGALVLAGFNHPGRELGCFDGCAYVPALDDRIVTIECFNRDDDYGAAYFRALDRGWHLGAIGVSDHHAEEWGNPALPRTGVLASALRLPTLQSALQARRVFATRSPTLALLLDGNAALMGSRLRLGPRAPLMLCVWCDDPMASQGWSRIELWTNGETLLETYETRGLRHVSWQTAVLPQDPAERWFAVRVLHADAVRAYSSPIWARWALAE
jgi:hypothetical protein